MLEYLTVTTYCTLVYSVIAGVTQLPVCCRGFSSSFGQSHMNIHKYSPGTMYCKNLMDMVISTQTHISSFCQSLSLSLTHSLSPYVGQSMCIDIFSVYWSPESRIGDHPRNRLSHFYVLRKWSGQVLSSISLSFTGSPPFSLFHIASDEELSRTL